jgi:hypothetical protein
MLRSLANATRRFGLRAEGIPERKLRCCSRHSKIRCDHEIRALACDFAEILMRIFTTTAVCVFDNYKTKRSLQNVL